MRTLTSEELYRIADGIAYRNWLLEWGRNKTTGLFIRWRFQAPCAVHGGMQWWNGRDWSIEGMDEDAIVKTAFDALKLTIEHETMEFFKYQGVVVFNPHTPLATLMAAQGA